jgi:glycosyltransferase involved in cell wall biosynthesis
VRVLHVTPYFAPAFVYGGPPRSILGLCRALQHAGTTVEVMTTTANGAANELTPATHDPRTVDGVPTRYFPLAEPRWLWNAAGIRAALRQHLWSYDVVHIHGLWHLPGWHAARLARARGVPYVISPRGMLEPEALAIRRGRKSVAFRLVEQRNLSAAAFLHATSPKEADTLKRRGFGPPVVYAANGVDPADPTGADGGATLRFFGIRSDDRFVMFLGRVHPIKRLDLLAAAMRHMRTRGVRAVIAGPDERGHRAVLAPLFHEAGVDTVWTGAVDERQKGALLAAASALVLCSDSESFGLAAAEAMAAATPVVVTRTCPWEELEREGAGLWVAHEPSAIAAALDHILEHPAAAKMMGERGRALVARRYTWDASARAIADGYARAAGVRPALMADVS